MRHEHLTGVAGLHRLEGQPPESVFADEPTAALDKASGHEALALLQRLARLRGTTVLMVTHDNRFLDMADRIVTMEEGRIVDDRRAGSA
jgi:putative ABC transport system ATP-binding protein